MFSVQQKREISEVVQSILQRTKHPELPSGEVTFLLHVDGAESGSWASIKNNGAVAIPSVNPKTDNKQSAVERGVIHPLTIERWDGIKQSVVPGSLLDCAITASECAHNAWGHNMRFIHCSVSVCADFRKTILKTFLGG